MVTAATNTLGGTLELEVRTFGTDCATFDGAPVVGPTPLDGALIGDGTPGPQTGDRVLTGLTNEVLCFQVSLPKATGNAFKNTTSAVTFTFAAEQTANNP
jgi:hypothetical protein